MGGEDLLRGTRDDIIRSLPDMKAVTATKPQTTVTLDEDQQPAAVEVNPAIRSPAGKTKLHRKALCRRSAHPRFRHREWMLRRRLLRRIQMKKGFV